jgi:MATE family multidrug resistance protein
MDKRDGSMPVISSETSPLLNRRGQNAAEDAPGASLPQTTAPSTELKLILKRSCPLICTFMMEHSFTAVTIFSVGDIGTVELSATSIGSLTANMTGYAVFQGLASCLDTLCPSAYGSGNKKLVGLHFQRMTCFLLLICIPIAFLWINSAAILGHFVRQEEVVKMAALYLRVLILGAPGYAIFECGKRFMMAQGLFAPTMWILIFCAPLNCFLNWLFVWVRLFQ